MSYIYYNPNPFNLYTDDCVIRAISRVLDQDWDTTYLGITLEGFKSKKMPSTNELWGQYLHDHGYRIYPLPDTCPDCYTVKLFCIDHPIGRYIVCTGSHIIAVINGNYYDTGDSGNEIPIYYWKEN